MTENVVKNQKTPNCFIIGMSQMSNIDIDKFYVSPYDKFLRKFDATHELTESQIKEIEKHQRIAHQRDHQLEQDPKDKIWADF